MSENRDRGGFEDSNTSGIPRRSASVAGLCLFPVAFALLMLVGCTGAKSVAKPADPSVADEYQIGPEDVLEISVWNEDHLQRTVLVRPDGNISFPLAGDLMAAGKTVPQLRNDLTKRLSRFVHDAQVFVSVEKITGMKIYVIGEVQKPGQYMIGRYVDVLQALSLAGGLTPYASKDEIQVVRRAGKTKAVYRFDYGAIKKGKSLEQNIMLQSDDVVIVP